MAKIYLTLLITFFLILPLSISQTEMFLLKNITFDSEIPEKDLFIIAGDYSIKDGALVQKSDWNGPKMVLFRGINYDAREDYSIEVLIDKNYQNNLDTVGLVIGYNEYDEKGEDFSFYRFFTSNGQIWFYKEEPEMGTGLLFWVNFSLYNLSEEDLTNPHILKIEKKQGNIINLYINGKWLRKPIYKIECKLTCMKWYGGDEYIIEGEENCMKFRCPDPPYKPNELEFFEILIGLENYTLIHDIEFGLPGLYMYDNADYIQGESKLYNLKVYGISPEDVNRDNKRNILDLILIRNHLGMDTSLEDNWKYDVNQDGQINISDLIAVRNHLNTNY